MSTSAQNAQPVRYAADAGTLLATLEEVDIRSQLESRPSRAPNFEGEEQAVSALAREMAENPRNMLQRLVEVAVELCRADTAGLSLLEGDVFRWEAVAGVFASYRNGTMPRAASPCGICIDRNGTQLMHLPDRFFPALRAEPPFVEALLIPFHHENKPVGTVWVVAHTEARKFDREDERLMRVLAQFASAGWQLWTAREQAERANQRKDEFLALLGHELRTPLETISSAAHVLEGSGTEALRRQATDVIRRSVTHLARLSTDLQDLSRIGRGELRLEPRRLTLQVVITAATEMARNAIESRAQTLSVDLPQEPIILTGDLTRLTQVFCNLLENAGKYSPDGSHIALLGMVRGDQAEVRIRDQGIGIAAEDLPNIFTAFTQGRGARERNGGGGLGLGLAIVRRLVELHGGTVSATSAGTGQGSEFTVRLPV